MDSNKIMIREFARQCVRLFDSIGDGCGQVLVSHKTKPPYNHWDIRSLMVHAGDSSDSPKNLVYSGSFVFDKCLFPLYTNRKALDKKSFTMHDAVCHVFTVDEDDIDWDEEGFVLVTEGIIEELRCLFLEGDVLRRSVAKKGKGKKRKGEKQENNDPTKRR